MALAANGSGMLSASEGVIAGFLVFCIHSRSRCSDGARISIEPSLDESPNDDPECSFVEAVTTGDKVKTGNTPAKSKLQLPVVGLSRGVSNLPWAEAWLKLRSDQGFEASKDECLMTEPFANGTFGVARLGPGQATEWLRHLLASLGFDPTTLTNVGSHSCKATLLSVAAKAGMPRDYRRTLGGHALPGDASVDVYSRDTLAAPLLSLGQLLTKVRDGHFLPDSSRSGRWVAVQAIPAELRLEKCKVCDEPLREGTGFKCSCENWVHDSPQCFTECDKCGDRFCNCCSSLGFHVCHFSEPESDGSTSESEVGSDGEEVQMLLEDEEDDISKEDMRAAYLKKGIHNGSDAVFPEGGIFVNVYTNVAHQIRDPQSTACGVCASQTKFAHYYDQFALKQATLCWRPGCANWLRNEADEDSDSSSSDQAEGIAEVVAE